MEALRPHNSNITAANAVTKPPLHTCVPLRRTPFYRLYAAAHTCGILALLWHHTNSLINSLTLINFLFFISDVVLAFMWTTTQTLRMNPRRREEFPERYKEASGSARGFPALDVFICTADPHKEPPIGVVNTALSVMGYDYPSDKISVYVSDDGGSPLTLFALMEAAEFAKRWLPFCKTNNLLDRSPEAYFASDCYVSSDEAENIKIIYEDMKTKIQQVVERGKVNDEYLVSDKKREIFNQWTDDFTRQDHPTLIEVVVEASQDRDESGELMPNLIYLSREKRKGSNHHFKAGALNTLLRVSAVMTNSPVVITLDCDMNSNDPQTPLRALCYLSDQTLNSNLAWIQFPQKFRGINRSDIYATEYKRLFHINLTGLDGLFGPTYIGTGSFFNRRAFFGGPPSPIQPEIQRLGPDQVVDRPIKDPEVLALSHKVARCDYEEHTDWGSKIGFRYGSLVEDYFTGFNLHSEGWRSIYCSPKRAAFYGDAPISLFDVLNQQKRWSLGLVEVTFCKDTMLINGIRKLGLLPGLAYCHYSMWAFWCIPITIYAFIPQLALLHGVSVFPKASEPWFWVYVFLFIGGYGQDLLDFKLAGGTFRCWWNDQRMWLLRGVSCHLFGFVECALKQLNIRKQGFNLTSKVMDDEQSKRYDQELFEFGVSSPLFLPLAAAAVINLFASVRGAMGLIAGGNEEGFTVLQVLLCWFVCLNCWPVYQAMVLRVDKGKMPATISGLAVLVSWFIYLLGRFL